MSNEIINIELLSKHPQLLYYNDPILFTAKVMNMMPDVQQAEVLNSMINNTKVSVKSGRGCGKTYAAAMVIWWFLCTRYKPKIFVTAPAGGTIAQGIWPTLADLYDRMDKNYKKDFIFQSTQIKNLQHPFSWFVVARTGRKEAAESMSGGHAENMLYVADEASGVPDEIYHSILGSLTEADNYFLMLSNPKRLSGTFFNSFMKPKFRDEYHQITMSCIDSKFVSRKSIDFWKNTYGEDSDEYRVHVLGEFPESEENSIIPSTWVLNATARDEVEAEGQMFWGLDIAAGKDATVLIKRKGRKVYPDIKKWKYKDTMKSIGAVINEYNIAEEKPDRIFVDSIAIGKPAFDRLNEKGLPVVPANAGQKAADKRRYANQKTEWWATCRDWFASEKPSIPSNNQQLVDELCTYEGYYGSDGRFHTETKDKYIRRNPLIGSPDHADALVMTFCKKYRKTVGLITV